ncbi:hypothetical protein EGI31_07395 [Lacihabitans soyangensis]|uniref:Uncharacterized protein n=2 Tax=Lacihabitans soyangensis TaxID=869394 RepID=A0AAE3H185_9BACT|nr:hypothetical protein [Lacihabitans soyangensis]
MRYLLVYKNFMMFVEIVVFLFAFWHFKKITLHYLRAFIIFTGIILILDLVGRFPIPRQIINIIYIIVGLLEFCGLFFVFYLFDMSNKWFSIISSLTLLIFFVIEPLWGAKTIEINFKSMTNSVGCLFLLILTFIYFFKLTKSANFLKFYEEPMFWIASGCLVYYLGTFPYWGLYNVMLNQYFDILVIYTWITTTLAIGANILYFVSFRKAINLMKYE